jgi:hypothetical protein
MTTTLQRSAGEARAIRVTLIFVSTWASSPIGGSVIEHVACTTAPLPGGGGLTFSPS